MLEVVAHKLQDQAKNNESDRQTESVGKEKRATRSKKKKKEMRWIYLVPNFFYFFLTLHLTSEPMNARSIKQSVIGACVVL